MSCPNWYSDEAKAFYNLKDEVMYRLARSGFDGDKYLERIPTSTMWAAMERAMLDMSPGRESGMCIHLGSLGICRVMGEVGTCDPIVKCIHYGLSCQESGNQRRKEGFTYYVWRCPECRATDAMFVVNTLSGKTEVYWMCRFCDTETYQVVPVDKLEEQVKHGDEVCIYLTPCNCGKCEGEYKMCKRNGVRLANCAGCEFYRAYVKFADECCLEGTFLNGDKACHHAHDVTQCGKSCVHHKALPILEQVEVLRQDLAEKIIQLTGLDPSDVEVEIGLQQPKGINDDLATEARFIDWHPDRHGESAWYTSEKPGNGATTVYVE